MALDAPRDDRRSGPRVDLSRNFGHHKAMMTGLSYARGDLVFLIDSDLEEDPGTAGRLCRTLRTAERRRRLRRAGEHAKAASSNDGAGSCSSPAFNLLVGSPDS